MVDFWIGLFAGVSITSVSYVMLTTCKDSKYDSLRDDIRHVDRRVTDTRMELGDLRCDSISRDSYLRLENAVDNIADKKASELRHLRTDVIELKSDIARMKKEVKQITDRANKCY